MRDLLDLIRLDELTERANAEGGDPNAQFKLGEMYRQGSGCAQDLSKALHWLREAAEQDQAQAQERLAEMLDHGKGVPRNLKEAAMWYRKAAEQGRAKAQARLAAMLDRGEGVPRNLEDAAVWYRKAAERDDETAQLRLAEILDKGEGVPRNRKEAAKWYRRLAVRVNLEAMAWINAFDTEEAEKLREEAMRGSVKARLDLAEAYEEGRGVQSDIVLAWMWGRLAADGGHEDAGKFLELLERDMTEAEALRAQRSVREWNRTHS